MDKKEMDTMTAKSLLLMEEDQLKKLKAASFKIVNEQGSVLFAFAVLTRNIEEVYTAHNLLKRKYSDATYIMMAYRLSGLN